MAKRTYRAVPVQQLDMEILREQLIGETRVVVGCDAAKDSWRGAVMTTSFEVVQFISWDAMESHQVLSLLTELREAGTAVEVAMEPTGTYADAFAYRMQEAGFPVYAVSPKHTHDYAEIYDGVPSQHDTKDAAIVAELHLKRRQPSVWPTPSMERRELRARCAQVDWLKQDAQQDQGRAEGLLARHWPEVLRELDLDSASLFGLMTEFGSAQAVAADSERARQLLQKWSRGLLAQDKIERVLRGASSSLGIPPTESEQQMLRALGRRMQSTRAELRKAERAVMELVSTMELVQALGQCIGAMTAAILVAYVGDPRQFPSARAFYKQLGLNLRERSSGKSKGKLKISKRGNSIVRRWLFLAALRLLKNDPVARAWVEHKAQRPDGTKMKAIVALMRKLASALRHVAHGQSFDSSKLFDVARLKRLRALPTDFHPAPAV